MKRIPLILEDIRLWLDGRKTYIVSALMVAAALVNALSGDMSWADFANSPDLWMLLNGLGLGFLRASVAKL